MSRTWSLEELAEESQRYLDDDGDSKRVQWKPNGRQIRYYSTLGLLDKPETENGRTVWYGPKHLLQLLAIKRLQQDGMKLADIQRALAGATVEKMRSLVGLPEGFLGELDDSVKRPSVPATGESQASGSHPRRATAFWTARPAPSQPDHPQFEHCWRLELAPGVNLTLDEKQAQRLSDEEREQLARALTETWWKLNKRTKE
jgi:DNA-binding transcriptional MerR regulator